MSYCECNYDYDPPEFYQETYVKRARRQHICDECCGPIFAGEPYRRVTGVWESEFCSHNECIACQEIRQWATISMPCFCCNMLGELHDTVREMVDDLQHDIPGFLFEWGRRMVRLRWRERGATYGTLK